MDCGTRFILDKGQHMRITFPSGHTSLICLCLPHASSICFSRDNNGLTVLNKGFYTVENKPL